MSGTCKSSLLTVLVSVIIFVDSKEISRIHQSNGLEPKTVGKIVLTMPVLAPLKSSKAEVIETAKDFPSLMVIATDNDDTINGEELNDKGHDEDELHPIYYVKKLDEKNQNRRRRRRISAMLLGRP